MAPDKGGPVGQAQASLGLLSQINRRPLAVTRLTITIATLRMPDTLGCRRHTTPSGARDTQLFRIRTAIMSGS